jgi:hypothetical protein
VNVLSIFEGNVLEDLNATPSIIHFLVSEKSQRVNDIITARNKIKSEIEATKMRNDFYRYLSWVIQSAPLKKRVVHRYTNFYVSTFTDESWKIIESFVYPAVEIFNVPHPLQTTTVEKTLQTLEEGWDYDHEEYVWEQEIMKGTQM